MNDKNKSIVELHGMLKTTEESIKKTPNHMIIVQKEKETRKHWTPPKGKDKKKCF
jgi:hypothetical protein